jgi:two-component system CheB/CheR fusion protein
MSERHVLLVEDDKAVCESLRFLLEQWGYEVAVATDGLRGIEEARARRPDVVVVDIGLPLIDGCEVARQVRSARADRVLLVAISGSGRPQDKLLVASAGFDHFLTKPVEPEALRLTLLDG